MRSRIIRPGFFENDVLASLPHQTRLMFIGLWCLADRQGRLKDRPCWIRAKIFPYEDCQVEEVLNSLQATGFIQRYVADGVACIQILNFQKHQRPHVSEPVLGLPDPVAPTFSVQSTENLSASTYIGKPNCPLTLTLTRTLNTNTPLTPLGGNDVVEPRQTTASKPRQPRQTTPDGFSEFWQAYPRKVAKAAALKAWAKLAPGPELLATILADLKRRVDWTPINAAYVPHPATYLNGRRWEDETVSNGKKSLDEIIQHTWEALS